MSEFLDIGGFIEQTVQEVLNENPIPACTTPTRPAPSHDRPISSAAKAFRIGQTTSSISLNQASPRDIGLVEDRSHEDGEALVRSEPAVGHKGSFAANLWGGPGFYAQMILKKKPA